MKRPNEDIREKIEATRIRHYEIAEQLKISPGTLSIWMRRELDTEKKERILKAVATLTGR